MVALVWDTAGEHQFETGVSKGVLYPISDANTYTPGVAWNGLTQIAEKPDGAASTPQYADNIKYLDLYSVETFGGTIEAFTYPDAFAACDGTAEPKVGVLVGQQNRKKFGLCYKTIVGNDSNSEAGYKLHLVYGATASPSEKDYASVNDTPAPVAFSWDFETTPVAVTDLKPTSLLVVDSTLVDPDDLASLEAILYGGSSAIPTLPLPDAVIALFTDS